MSQKNLILPEENNMKGNSCIQTQVIINTIGDGQYGKCPKAAQLHFKKKLTNHTTYNSNYVDHCDNEQAARPFGK